MIHRWLGGVLGIAALAGTLFDSAPALSACRSTTCGIKPVPVGCTRDPVTTCWTSGIPLVWPGACVGFSVDDRGVPSLGLDFSGAEALVISAFASWPTATCPTGFPSISVQSLGPLSCYAREYNAEGPNSNAVVFFERDWPRDPQAIGLTTVTFGVETGEITAADLEINLANFGLDQNALRYVLLHEAGHFFGIDHSADTNAVMFANYSAFAGPTAPGLTPDDVLAICAAYPPERPVVECDFEPEGGLSPVCGGDIEGGCALARGAARPSSTSLLLMLPAFGLALRARRRRSTLRVLKR